MSVPNLMRELATQRPVFHSEDDFKFALGWLLANRLPDTRIRFERPRTAPKRIRVDLEYQEGKANVAVELKYKTRPLSATIHDEPFSLAGHGAEDLGKYDYWRDVERLEHLVATRQVDSGTALMLTNDSAYWSASRIGTIVEDFDLSEGRVASGVLAWPPHASTGTTKGRERNITLIGSYRIQWMEYSQVGAGPNSRFRYTVVQIDRSGLISSG